MFLLLLLDMRLVDIRSVREFEHVLLDYDVIFSYLCSFGLECRTINMIELDTRTLMTNIYRLSMS